MKTILFLLASFMIFSADATAQPRPAERPQTQAAIAQGPSTVPAKYEGGMFGFSKREAGTLKMDDDNKRLVFLGKDGKEIFGMPYSSIAVLSPQSRSVSTTAGTVVSHIPLPGAGLASLLREKKRYLVVQFSDPDADARGVVNFKIENKALLESVIRTLGEKAEMTQRGDAYYRPKVNRTTL